jgi:hypothetical protein
MNILKSALIVVLFLAVSGGGFYAGRKTSSRVMVLDPKIGQWVPLAAPNGAHVFVASPEGYQSGIYAAHDKTGKNILILPPSLIPDSSDQAQPQNQHEETEQIPLKRA